MSKGIIAIDPGLSGAIAFLIDGDFGAVYDMPVETKQSGRRQVDAYVLIDLLADLAQRVDGTVDCLIEQVSAMPGQGVSGMFSLGDSFGVARAAAHASAHRVRTVTPVVWKRRMNLTKDKEWSRKLARDFFPSARSHLDRKKDEGRAEALLLAKYAHSEFVW